jgi:hypothetical protein
MMVLNPQCAHSSTRLRMMSSQPSSKKGASLARARKEHWPVSLAKVIKKAVSLSELITEKDQAASLRVLRRSPSQLSMLLHSRFK